MAGTDLVELTTLDPTILLDVRYAREDNFLGRPVYPQARAFLQRAAAQALVRVHRSLASEGLGLLVFDGYRPWSVTKMFWDATPQEHRIFVADPEEGSRHNRGCAVDVTLFDRATGQPLPMPSDFDEFTERAYADWGGASEPERINRARLRAAMEQEDFKVFEFEWWHFDHGSWEDHPVLDLTFADIDDRRQDVRGAMGILEKAGQTLMVANWRDLGAGRRLCWDLPGGTVRSGESAEDACIREFSEETGLAVRVKELAFVVERFGFLSDDPNRRTVYFFFAVEPVDPEQQPVPCDPGIVEAAFRPDQELSALCTERYHQEFLAWRDDRKTRYFVHRNLLSDPPS